MLFIILMFIITERIEISLILMFNDQINNEKGNEEEEIHFICLKMRTVF